MAEQTPTTPAVQTALYRLVAQKIGRDPLKLISERRAETPPVPYARIRDELVELSGEYITHEAPRRWHQQAMAQADAQQNTDAA